MQLPYHRAMWAPLVLLHLTLAGRVATPGLVGIGLRALPVWQLALLGNVAALLLFIITAVTIGVRATRRAAHRRTTTRTETHA